MIKIKRTSRRRGRSRRSLDTPESIGPKFWVFSRPRFLSLWPLEPASKASKELGDSFSRRTIPTDRRVDCTSALTIVNRSRPPNRPLWPPRRRFCCYLPWSLSSPRCWRQRAPCWSSTGFWPNYLNGAPTTVLLTSPGLTSIIGPRDD